MAGTTKPDDENIQKSTMSPFLPFSEQAHGGVTVGAADYSHSGILDIVTGSTMDVPVYRVVPATSMGFLPPALLEDSVPDLTGMVAVGA